MHPEGAESTSAASSRPEAADAAPGTTGGRAGESGANAGTPTDTPSRAEEKPRAGPHGAEKRRVTGDDGCGDEVHNDEVEGDEPLLPARVHRPSDLMRLLVGFLAIVVLLAIAAFAHGTTSGLEQDINKGTGQAPDLLIKIAGLASSIAILLVPVAFAIERLIKRDGLRIADGPNDTLYSVLAHSMLTEDQLTQTHSTEEQRAAAQQAEAARLLAHH